jgi:hypothetical protein
MVASVISARTFTRLLPLQIFCQVNEAYEFVAAAVKARATASELRPTLLYISKILKKVFLRVTLNKVKGLCI